MVKSSKDRSSRCFPQENPMETWTPVNYEYQLVLGHTISTFLSVFGIELSGPFTTFHCTAPCSVYVAHKSGNILAAVRSMLTLANSLVQKSAQSLCEKKAVTQGLLFAHCRVAPLFTCPCEQKTTQNYNRNALGEKKAFRAIENNFDFKVCHLLFQVHRNV